jgi:ABC-type lipoprotein export system ATPase subunit
MGGPVDRPPDQRGMTLDVGLRHAFGGFTLDAAFAAPAGITVLFGRSGSGKTTIVNAVAGLLRPNEGRIALGDAVLTDTGARVFLPAHRRRIGYIFQEGRLFPHLSVQQNLRYGAFFAPKGARREDMGRVVDLLGIGHLLDRRPGALSGGEKQRVAIGRALLSAPRLILADEPLASLDEARKAEILPYFERLRDEISVPVLAMTGGIILFLVALQTVLHQSESVIERPKEDSQVRDLKLALTPLAFPTIVTPYGIAAVIVFATLASGDRHAELTLAGIVLLILAMDWAAMLFAEVILRWVRTSLQVFAVVLGVTQIALGLQVILHSLSMIGVFVERAN